MTLSKLQKAVTVVNNRYANGLNDDDQVAKMFQIANLLKGHTAIPEYDTYRVGTDLEWLEIMVNKYGYWSEQVKAFNATLSKKGGIDYMQNLNNIVKPLR